MLERKLFVCLVVVSLLTLVAVPVLATDSELYVLSGGAIWRFDADTGAPLPSAGNTGAIFSPAGQLTEPTAIDFGPDGNVYVSANKRTPVLDHYWGEAKRFDGVTGTYIGRFIDGGGDDAAREMSYLQFHNGYLWASWRDWPNAPGAIVKYDQTTGAQVSVFSIANGMYDPQSFDWLSDGNMIVANGSTPLIFLNGTTGAKMFTFDPGFYHQKVAVWGNYVYVNKIFGNTINRFLYDSANMTMTLDPSWTISRPLTDSYYFLIANNMIYASEITANRVSRFDVATGAFIDEIVPTGAYGIHYPYQMAVKVVPEPSSMLALGAGLTGLVAFLRRRRA